MGDNEAGRAVSDGPVLGLVIGNGLALDFLKPHPIAKEKWHPQRPFGWELSTPGKPGLPFLKALPELERSIAQARALHPNASDFDLFPKFVKRFPVKSTDFGGGPEFSALLEAESRHFLAIAYSHFELVIGELEARNWHWGRWIAEHVSMVHGAVSLNYDLLFERLLATVGRAYWRFGFDGPPFGMRLLKPHGSVDFGPAPGMLDGFPAEYPL